MLSLLLFSQVDPDSARVVFEAGVSLTMVPLEVTHTALATTEVLAAIRGAIHDVGHAVEARVGPNKAANYKNDANGDASDGGSVVTPFREMVHDLLLFFAGTYREVFNFEHPPLHDPCAVAYAIAPQLFETRTMRVDIETKSELSLGQTVREQDNIPAVV